MDSFVNKNERQMIFNELRGTVTELNDADIFCSITLQVGHENHRMVNFTVRKKEFQQIVVDTRIGDKVCIRFYAVSNKKNDRWYTALNVLAVSRI